MLTAATNSPICLPGRYTMLVSRNGYVTLQFGQQRPFEPGARSSSATRR